MLFNIESPRLVDDGSKNVVVCVLLSPTQSTSLFVSFDATGQNLLNFEVFDARVIFSVLDYGCDSGQANGFAFQVSYSLMLQDGFSVPAKLLVLIIWLAAI